MLFYQKLSSYLRLIKTLVVTVIKIGGGIQNCFEKRVLYLFFHCDNVLFLGNCNRFLNLKEDSKYIIPRQHFYYKPVLYLIFFILEKKTKLLNVVGVLCSSLWMKISLAAPVFFGYLLASQLQINQVLI